MRPVVITVLTAIFYAFTVIAGPAGYYPNLKAAGAKSNIGLAHFEKRNVQYLGQSDSRPEISQISSESLHGKLNGYAFPFDTGKKIYIYHIEQGIPAGHEKEFPPDRVEKALVTPEFKHLKRYLELRPTTHSICVASKALGTYFGTGKKSIYVPVQLSGMVPSEIGQGFRVAADHIKATGRQKQAIVILSWLGGANAFETRDFNTLTKSIHALFNLGVPSIVGAGNDAKEKDRWGNFRLDVDGAPASLASEDFPLIVVGSTDEDGSISDFSQRGDKVTGYTRGNRIDCELLDGPSDQINPPLKMNGTSFAAPAYAGVIATEMSMKSGKFFDATHHLTGLEFVKAVRDFFANKAYKEHQKGVKSLWNFVTPQTPVEWRNYRQDTGMDGLQKSDESTTDCD